MPGCSPGVSPHCPVGERVFSTPPFQDNKFVGCSLAWLPGHFQLELQACFDIPERPLRACQGLEHSARHPHCLGIHLSIHFAQKQGFLVRAVLFGEGAGAGGPGSPWRVPSPSRYSGVSGGRCWRGSVFPSAAALQRSSSQDVFFGMGPLASRPDTITRPRHHGQTGQGAAMAQICLCPSPVSWLLWHLRALVSSARTTVPKKPLERAMGSYSSLNAGFAGLEQEQPGARALLLPRGHISAPSSLGLLNQNRCEGSRAAGQGMRVSLQVIIPALG